MFCRHVEINLLILSTCKLKEKETLLCVSLCLSHCKGYRHVLAARYLAASLKGLALDLSIFNICPICCIISILLY